MKGHHLRALALVAASSLGGLMLIAAPAPAAGDHPFYRGYHFPRSSQYVTVAEGGGEAVGRGSYAVRVYASGDEQEPPGNFIVGAVRARSGHIRELAFRDLDGDGSDEVIVVMRQSGPAGLLAADAIGYRSGVVYLLEAVADLTPDTDPFTALKKALNGCDCQKY